ncbi:hypothetical protein [Paraburkholderia sediminicola]|uniref:hypothetical protein n=1 Tax=Paraburkholderia sediminicola TaxID=458836 RepID=UPI0038BDF30F
MRGKPDHPVRVAPLVSEWLVNGARRAGLAHDDRVHGLAPRVVRPASSWFEGELAETLGHVSVML